MDVCFLLDAVLTTHFIFNSHEREGERTATRKSERARARERERVSTEET